MTTSPYPHLFATLGEVATRLPDDLARTLEDTFVALQSGNSTGQPWPGSNRTPGQRLALARIDRANAGLSSCWNCCTPPHASAWTGISTSRWVTARAKGCFWPAVGWPSMWMCSCGRRDSPQLQPAQS